MADLDHAAIESLLNEGALRRGVPVDAYRNLVQATADNAAGVTFEEALQVVVAFDRMPPREHKPWSRLPFLKEAAARYGASVSRSVKIMLCGDDGKSPARD